MSTTGQPLNPLSPESGCYCPLCRDQRGDRTIDMVRDRGNGVYRCVFGHTLPPEALRMLRPDMKPFLCKEIPDPNLDIKPEIWLRKALWEPFSKKYDGRVWATINAVIQTMLDGDFLFLSGDCVRKLSAAGVRKEEEILAVVRRNAELIAENESLQKASTTMANLFANAAKSIGIGEDNSGQ